MVSARPEAVALVGPVALALVGPVALALVGPVALALAKAQEAKGRPGFAHTHTHSRSERRFAIAGRAHNLDD
ncbi:MAG: hypothetical protein EBX59_12250 [Betaproteobacteria bacterium]|nr:hypothetical protein [Betaproteobacteria bacterium]